MRVAVLLFAVACSQPAKHTTDTAAGSGSGSAPTAPPAPVEITVTTSDGLQKADKAAVTGKAGNAMLGAAVVLSDRTPIYCQPLERWPAEVAGKTVTAHGKLEPTDEFSASADGAGTSGSVWVLRDCTYDPPSP